MHSKTSSNIRIVCDAKTILSAPRPMKEMKKLLRNKLGLKPVKIKTPNLSGKHRGHCYLCFRSGDERQEAMDKLDGYKWKGQVIKAKVSGIWHSFAFEICIIFIEPLFFFSCRSWPKPWSIRC